MLRLTFFVTRIRYCNIEMHPREYTVHLSRDNHKEGSLETIKNLVNVNSKLVGK